jgi:hypothetical protein
MTNLAAAQKLPARALMREAEIEIHDWGNNNGSTDFKVKLPVKLYDL